MKYRSYIKCSEYYFKKDTQERFKKKLTVTKIYFFERSYT